MADYEALKKIGKNISRIITCPFIVPSNSVKEQEQVIPVCTIMGLVINTSYLILNATSYICPENIPEATWMREHWYIQGALITINAIDLAYEIYKGGSNKNKIPVTSSFPTPNAKPSELEVKATETPKIETPSEKLINPWDTNIPKYDNLALGDRR